MQNQNMFSRSTGKVVLILFIFLTSLTSCKKENSQTTKNQYWEIAWNHISAEQKATVVVDWKTARISVPSAENPEAASVMFNTNEDAILGPIEVLISIKNKKVIRVAPRF